jgi:hypothetical protein
VPTFFHRYSISRPSLSARLYFGVYYAVDCTIEWVRYCAEKQKKEYFDSLDIKKNKFRRKGGIRIFGEGKEFTTQKFSTENLSFKTKNSLGFFGFRAK